MRQLDVLKSPERYYEQLPLAQKQKKVVLDSSIKEEKIVLAKVVEPMGDLEFLQKKLKLEFVAAIKDAIHKHKGSLSISMGLKPCVYDELILQHNKDKIVLTTVVKGEVVIKEMHQLNMDETKDLDFLLGESWWKVEQKDKSYYLIMTKEDNKEWPLKIYYDWLKNDFKIKFHDSEGKKLF